MFCFYRGLCKQKTIPPGLEFTKSVHHSTRKHRCYIVIYYIRNYYCICISIFNHHKLQIQPPPYLMNAHVIDKHISTNLVRKKQISYSSSKKEKTNKHLKFSPQVFVLD